MTTSPTLQLAFAKHARILAEFASAQQTASRELAALGDWRADWEAAFNQLSKEAIAVETLMADFIKAEADVMNASLPGFGGDDTKSREAYDKYQAIVSKILATQP